MTWLFPEILFASAATVWRFFPPIPRYAIRIEFFGDEIERISENNALTGIPKTVVSHAAIYPASHYVTSRENLMRALGEIDAEMGKECAG
jgi:excinuclease UvrABC helicase subunit UvrB